MSFLTGLFPAHPFPTGSAVPVLKLSHAEEEEGECQVSSLCFQFPSLLFTCSMCGNIRVLAFSFQTLRDNPSVSSPRGVNKRMRRAEGSRECVHDCELCACSMHGGVLCACGQGL